MKIASGTTGRQILAVAAALVIVGGGVFWWSRPGANAAARLGTVYSPAGFGGYVPAAVSIGKPYNTPPKQSPRSLFPESESTRRDLSEIFNAGIQQAAEAYQAGRYAEAETDAKQVSASAHDSKGGLDAGKAEARADMIVAYSEARQHNLQSAREWFWKVQDEASKLPDHGARTQRLGEHQPTIEEEAAFQHAVCTGALGEQNEAEAEYKHIMKKYPDSPLVHASVKRIARFHGGNVPPESESIWKEAVKEAKRCEDARQAKVSRCGPECLAEVVHRVQGFGFGAQGRAEFVDALAKEMGTDRDGTSVEAFVMAAKKRGIPARGLMLTQNGLERQNLPIAAILARGHYVLVNVVNPTAVTIWDPYLNGPGKPGKREVKLEDWNKEWGGVTVALR
jgi:predicted double-glycine peptidase